MKQKLCVLALLVAMITQFLAAVPVHAGQEPAGVARGGSRQAAASRLDSTENILVLGTDMRDGDVSWRTDTILFVAIDKPTGEVGLLSIPRDLYVDLPWGGQNRINTLDYLGETTGYEGGGFGLLNDVLDATFGIRAHHYARVNLSALPEVVDALGGIDIYLESEFREHPPDWDSPTGWVEMTLPAGWNHLDGATTLQYVQARYLTSDFDRSRRQQQVLMAMRDRAMSMGWLTSVPRLWNTFSSSVETDLGYLDIMRLALMGANVTLEQVHVRTFGYGILSGYVTEAGAQVLVVNNSTLARNWVHTVFSAPTAASRATG